MVLHTPRISRGWVLPSDADLWHTQDAICGGFTSFAKDEAWIFDTTPTGIMCVCVCVELFIDETLTWEKWQIGSTPHSPSPVGWGYTIHWQYLCKGISTLSPPNECPVYETRQSNGKAPILEFWEMCSTHSLFLHPCPYWFGAIVPLRVWRVAVEYTDCISAEE